MKKTSISLKSFLFAATVALVTGPVIADISNNGSQGNVTIKAVITSAGPVTESSAGYRQNLVLTRFGNRELLQLLVQEEIIPYINGYRVVARYCGNGEFEAFYAVRDGSEERIPSCFMDLDCADGVDAESYVSRTGAYSAKVKLHSKMKLDGFRATLVENLTLASAFTKVNGENLPFFALTSQGFFHGIHRCGDIIEGVYSVARTTIVVHSYQEMDS
jgi:hypothetical protein